MKEKFHTISELLALLKTRKVSAVELTQEYLRRIHSRAASLNCFVSIHEDSALQAARKADEKIASGSFHSLTGVPLAHKDIFCIEGKRTTCCSRMLSNFVSPYSATVVANLEKSGAICLGTTNMDEFAMGSSNETSTYGPVRNPWDPSRVPGGSSGGSAAAVAAGLIPACTGSDTGGSIRQPASFCGVTGLKPTYGRNSRYGMVAFASSLDHPGTLTTSVEDAGRLLAAMAGYDHRDSTSANLREIDWDGESRPMRLGYPSRLFADLPLPISKCLDEARRTLENAGNSIIDIELPHFDVAVSAYYVISCAEASANLARYDGIRYGYRSTSPANVEDLYTYSRSEGFGLEVKRRILTGTFVLSVGHYDSYYVKAQKIRRLIRDDYIDAFQNVDVILSPSTPTTAFKLHAMDRDPTEMYMQDQFTVPVNMSGLPAMSIPCGFANGLPVGLQLIAPHFGESQLLRLGSAFQNLTNWHQEHPCPPPR